MKVNVKKLASVLLAVMMLFGVLAVLPASAAQAPDSVGAGFTVKAESNFFAAQTKTFDNLASYQDANGNVFVTVEYKLCAPAMYLMNIDIDSLTYDPAVLEWKEEYNRVDETNRLDFFPFAAENGFGSGTVNKKSDGLIVGNFSAMKPAALAYGDKNTAVTAVKATFKVLNKAAGTTTVKCDVDTLSYCDEADAYPTLKYIAIDKKTVNAANKAKATYSTDITAYKTAPVILGDVDGNGKVEINDVTELMRYLAEYTTENDLNLAVADVNFDGRVSVRDVTEIQRYLAKIIPSFR